MFTVRFETVRYRPDMQVTLRTNVDDWDKRDLVGTYAGGAWEFKLPHERYAHGFFFKFVLEKQFWMEGVNLFQQPIDDAVYTYTSGEVQFPDLFGQLPEVLVENGYVAQRFFTPNLDESKTYDVIVIGSGMGGGILADQLSDQGADTLVLEIGSYLFPTHIGNLPRQHAFGRRVDKNVWHLWDEFKVNAYTTAPGSLYIGGQGFYLGGRSLFWGGLAPRMSWWELERWPQEIRWYLEDPGYQLAEALLSVNRLESPYQTTVSTFLSTRFRDLVVLTAPMAVQHGAALRRSVPAGLFSTADLLMESKLTPGTTGGDKLAINLNHAAVKIVAAGRTATAVETYDLIADKPRTYHGKTVVLAAGTIESAKLVQLSALQDASGTVGKGLTDHPIFFTHFAIPVTSPHYRADSAAKLLLRHRSATRDNQRYNIIVELGADFNQGRFIDPELLQAHRDAKGDTMICEVVFLMDAPLLDENSVQQDGASYTKPVIQMNECPVTQQEYDEMRMLKDALIQALGGEALDPQDPTSLSLKRAGLGGVAHEVGTLRLGTDPTTSVVNTDLKFHAYDNLYACDLSVFPSSPAANPSLTLAALALRLAEHLRSNR